MILGERTPVGVRMSTPPASIPEHWNMCHTARRFQAAVASTMDLNPSEGSGVSPEDRTFVRKVVEKVDGSVVTGEWYVSRCPSLDGIREDHRSFGTMAKLPTPFLCTPSSQSPRRAH